MEDMSLSWNFLVTRYARNEMGKSSKNFKNFSFIETSTVDYIVSTKCRGNPVVENIIVLVNPVSCTCGYYNQFLLPCKHLLYIIKEKDLDKMQYVDKIWGKSTYLAYKEKTESLPVTLKSDFERSDCNKPDINRKPGRPKNV
ncbi:hypothetical protein BB558_002560 [Smittium angustum]|uniref:SWIM-type domain-containing protein n=1 Tax=Smittium angustum TaxID=133377 RepID=A0A2U1J8E8_SMIAN|nr:hypothetical protein BB558_002560 [Smittium angustum]